MHRSRAALHSRSARDDDNLTEAFGGEREILRDNLLGTAVLLASVLPVSTGASALASAELMSTARDRAESVSVSFDCASSAAKQLPYRAALRHTQ